MAASEKNMAAKKLQKSYFDVLGLCCSSEVPLIENILKPLDGIKDVSVIVPSRTVIVVHDSLLISQIQIVKALNQARLEANVRLNGEVNYRKKWPSPYAIICGLLLALSLFKFIYHPFKWLALGAVGVGIFPIARRGVVAIQNFRLDINILALIAVVGTCFLQDFLEAGTIVFLFTIAEWLESRASHKATAVMSSLMNMAPQKAVIADTGEVVDADEVKVNTVLAVKAGETIPIDGVVVEGNCEVDEKTLTGESFPVPKQKDSTVLAGTINLNGYISVKTTALAEDCVVARMAKLVEEAQNNKSSVQRFIDKCAKYYTPVVLLISIGFVVIPAGLRLHNEKYWFHLALVVLVSGCPCALVLSTPVATFCALSMAATSGILIKGGDYLEILAKIKIMAFDKTGTITRGEFVVTDFRSLHDDISLNTLLYWVSSIEGKSSHPMATALVEYGRSQSVEPKPEIVEEFQNFPGEGIGGKIDGRDIYVGNRRIAQRAGCEIVPTLEGDGGAGKTNGYIYCGTTPAGTFSLSDACRSGVMEAIKELKSLGIKTSMLTGDNKAAAMHAQEQLGNALELVHAELLPEDKARIIEGFKKEGPTAMVGDGMNDAPALATADIGISMGISGSALATETGHVILMSNDIRKIPKAIRLARRSHRKVIENVIISITTKSAILALAFAGHPLVWAAVLADVGTCVLVICNSMLLLRGTHKHGGKCCKSSSTLLVNKHGCNGGSCQSSNVRQHSHCDNEDNDMPEPKKCSSQKHGGECCKSSSTLFVNKHGCNGGSCQSSLVHRHLHCDNEDNEMSEPKNCSSQKLGGECCKSSATVVVNKHGSNGGSCQSSHVHQHPHCDNEDNEMSEPKKCSSQKCAPNCHSPPLSSSSCENKRCSESAEGTAISSSCGRVKCKNSVEKQDGCIRSSVLLNSDHCNHGCSEKNGHEMVSEHDHHLNHEQSSSGLGQQTRNNGHSCHEKDQHCDGHGFSESRKICCESKGEPAAMHASPSLEKREIGGCCKSLRKDCCAKDRHLGTSLSEIVVE